LHLEGFVYLIGSKTEVLVETEINLQRRLRLNQLLIFHSLKIVSTQRNIKDKRYFFNTNGLVSNDRMPLSHKKQ